MDSLIAVYSICLNIIKGKDSINYLAHDFKCNVRPPKLACELAALPSSWAVSWSSSLTLNEVYLTPNLVQMLFSKHGDLSCSLPY